MEQTSVESLIDSLLPFLDRTKISDQMLQNIIEEHLLKEKKQFEELKDFDTWKEWKNRV